MCKGVQVRGQDMEETEECDWSTGSKEKSGQVMLVSPGSVTMHTALEVRLTRRNTEAH